jgi:hypothetical protein
MEAEAWNHSNAFQGMSILLTRVFRQVASGIYIISCIITCRSVGLKRTLRTIKNKYIRRKFVLLSILEYLFRVANFMNTRFIILGFSQSESESYVTTDGSVGQSVLE